MAKPTRVSAPAWIARIFRAKAARTGGIVRRKVSSVIKYASVSALKREVRRRGFHLVRAGDDFLIFCNAGNFRVIT